MQLKPISTILSLLRVLSISGCLFAASTYAQQIDKTAPPETLVRVVDLEIHTHTLSDNEISNIGRFIMGTFVGRTPKTIMGYSDKASYYDVRLDVYVLKRRNPLKRKSFFSRGTIRSRVRLNLEMLQDRILDLPVFLLGLNCVAPTRNPLLHPPLAHCYGQEPASDPKSWGFALG